MDNEKLDKANQLRRELDLVERTLGDAEKMGATDYFQNFGYPDRPLPDAVIKRHHAEIKEALKDEAARLRAEFEAL